MSVAQHAKTKPSLILNHLISSTHRAGYWGEGRRGGSQTLEGISGLLIYTPELHKTDEWLTIRGTLLNPPAKEERGKR